MLSQLINPDISNAISWTLIQVLWQGAVFAIVLAVIKWFSRNKSANLRYTIAIFFLFLIVTSAFANYYSYQYKFQDNDIKVETLHAHFNIKTLEANIDKDNNQSFIEFLFGKHKTIEKYSHYIFYFWIFGVLVYLLRFIIDLYWTKQLKSSGIQIKSQKILNLFKSLTNLIGVNKLVDLIESAHIKSPVVIGYLKPVIVLPIGFITSLPVEHIEAIIAHELAHIKRHDYIINILQSLIEAIFFFHPGVWYISSVIRSERENCCDDIAIEACGESVTYAKALVHIQSLQLENHYSAVAFSGRRKQLLNRIKRMTMKPKRKSNLLDKMVASVIIIAGIATIALSAKARSNENREIDRSMLVQPVVEVPKVVDQVKAEVPKITEKIIKPFSRDTIKHKRLDYYIEDGKITRKIREKGKKKEMELIMEEGKVKELYIDGEKIPEDEMDNYKEEIDETLDDLADAEEDIRDAMVELENINEEEIREEIESAMSELENLNLDEMYKEIEESMKDIEIDIRSIHEQIEDLDLSDVEEELQRAFKELKDIDFDFDFDTDLDLNKDFHIHLDYNKEHIEKIMEELKEHKNITKEELEKILDNHKDMFNAEDFKRQIEEAKEQLKQYQNEDYTFEFTKQKEESLKKLEKQLEELEKLELEEEK